MPGKLDHMLRAVYKKWKLGFSQKGLMHPDEEEMACFAEGRLSAEEIRAIKEHLTACEICSEAFAVQARIKSAEDKFIPVPPGLVEDAKGVFGQEDQSVW